MALRDSININTKAGGVYESSSYDRRVWTEENEMLEIDTFREDIYADVVRWYGCTRSACIGALQAVENKQITETTDESLVETGRYWVDQRKTSPRSYVFEWSQDWRKRYKNGAPLGGET